MSNSGNNEKIENKDVGEHQPLYLRPKDRPPPLTVRIRKNTFLKTDVCKSDGELTP